MYIDNLLLLATRLEQLPTNYNHFNMSDFVTENGGYSGYDPEEITKRVIHSCGTCACALGHAPTIRGLNAHKGEHWDDYCLRVFGISEQDLAWDFLFGSEWAHQDDPRHHTAHAAAKRIRYAVDNGVPPRNGWLEYIDA